ncbi:zf-HC2 domain-containing protein [Ilumatobacter nonamiensis]|uniref:zf-HC2 domain-containing protein n=1 Tax=Ilumatobacter nonamiensis TaxID=467093 RepID=UPI000346BEF0|nr:zf-HC2 domain-containing protein [Ilumatobacter nonamiensis]
MDAEQLSCDTAHEILSARMDGEATAPEMKQLDHHLAGCPACEQLSAQFLQLDRRVRLRPAVAVPDLRPAILSRARPAVLGRNGWRRPALAWVAFLLIAQNAAALVAGQMSGAEVHLARHLGAFGVALGVGLAFVAWRPHRAYGMLPFAGALLLTMLLSAGFDIAENGRSAVSEMSHLTELAGLALAWMIAGSPGRPDWGAIRDNVRERLPQRA